MASDTPKDADTADDALPKKEAKIQEVFEENNNNMAGEASLPVEQTTNASEHSQDSTKQDAVVSDGEDVADAVPFIEEPEEAEKESKDSDKNISQEKDEMDSRPFVEDAEAPSEYSKNEEKMEDDESRSRDEVDSAPLPKQEDSVPAAGMDEGKDLTAETTDEVAVAVEEEQMDVDAQSPNLVASGKHV